MFPVRNNWHLHKSPEPNPKDESSTNNVSFGNLDILDKQSGKLNDSTRAVFKQPTELEPISVEEHGKKNLHVIVDNTSSPEKTHLAVETKLKNENLPDERPLPPEDLRMFIVGLLNQGKRVTVLHHDTREDLPMNPESFVKSLDWHFEKGRISIDDKNQIEEILKKHNIIDRAPHISSIQEKRKEYIPQVGETVIWKFNKSHHVISRVTDEVVFFEDFKKTPVYLRDIEKIDIPNIVREEVIPPLQEQADITPEPMSLSQQVEETTVEPLPITEDIQMPVANIALEATQDIEQADEMLSHARSEYARLLSEYKNKVRESKSRFQKIMDDLGVDISRKMPDVPRSDELVRAEAEYIEAKKQKYTALFGEQEMKSRITRTGITEHEETIPFNQKIIDEAEREYDLLRKQVIDFMPAKERNRAQKIIKMWTDVPLSVRVGITSTLLGVGFGVGAGMGVFGVAAYTGYRATKALAGAGVSAGVGKAFDIHYKKKNEKSREEALNEYGTAIDASNFLEKERGLMNYLSEEENIEKKQSLKKGLAMMATGGLATAAIGGFFKPSASSVTEAYGGSKGGVSNVGETKSAMGHIDRPAKTFIAPEQMSQKIVPRINENDFTSITEQKPQMLATHDLPGNEINTPKPFVAPDSLSRPHVDVPQVAEGDFTSIIDTQPDMPHLTPDIMGQQIGQTVEYANMKFNIANIADQGKVLLTPEGTQIGHEGMVGGMKRWILEPKFQDGDNFKGIRQAFNTITHGQIEAVDIKGVTSKVIDFEKGSQIEIVKGLKADNPNALTILLNGKEVAEGAVTAKGPSLHLLKDIPKTGPFFADNVYERAFKSKELKKVLKDFVFTK